MRMIICAGPPTSGKTAVLKQVAKRLIQAGKKLAYLKEDVQYADEDEIFRNEFGVPARKIITGDLCPDHSHVLVLKDAFLWAQREGADVFLVETAGLCLRCAPYVEHSLGICVVEVTSGMNLPRKIGPMLSLADIAVVTKIDLVSQAEREVFRANVRRAVDVPVIEVDALHGVNIDRLVEAIESSEEVTESMTLRGNPPLAVCTVCAGKKEIGWEKHFGVVRTLDSDPTYRGQ